jgi:hypothetical protein
MQLYFIQQSELERCREEERANVERARREERAEYERRRAEERREDNETELQQQEQFMSLISAIPKKE